MLVDLVGMVTEFYILTSGVVEPFSLALQVCCGPDFLREQERNKRRKTIVCVWMVQTLGSKVSPPPAGMGWGTLQYSKEQQSNNLPHSPSPTFLQSQEWPHAVTKLAKAFA